MPSSDRKAMRDRERERDREMELDREREREREASNSHKSTVRHHASSSSLSSALVPMWDSSDPDRNPPPLPLNPSSPVSTNPRASTAIVKAANAITERLRESTPSPFIRDAPLSREGSPTRDLLKGAAHRRMQSQSVTTPIGNVRELSHLLEGGRKNDNKSSERSPERGSLRKDTPSLDSLRESNSYSPIRPSSRLLVENTPPSATLIALRNTPTPLETPVLAPVLLPASMTTPLTSAAAAAGVTPITAPITLPSTTTSQSKAMVRTSQAPESLSAQIAGLTSIATSLKTEMASLSRRSKDNAADLVALQRATSTRDEDIRKALKDLLQNVTLARSDSVASARRSAIDSVSSLLLDDKPHFRGEGKPRGHGLSRAKSSETLNSDASSMRFSTASYAMDGTAILALLEKVVREMAPKTGQDQIITGLSELIKAIARDGASSSQKLDEVLERVKSSHEKITAMPVRPPPGMPGARNFSGQVRSPTPQRVGPGSPSPEHLENQLMRVNRDVASPRMLNPHGKPPTDRRLSAGPADMSDDPNKLLQRLKESMTENGGLTAETKALVRELRGEVLGMGRDIARKLEQAQSKAKDDGESSEKIKATVAQVVEEGLDELKGNMERLFRENRRQSNSSVSSRLPLDKDEVYNIVRQALEESQEQNKDRELEDEQKTRHHGRLHILEAVREAWQMHKVDDHSRTIGLDKDEILECLKEGFEDVRRQNANQHEHQISRDDVMHAIKEGLDNFKPPVTEAVSADPALTREEMLEAFRECMETIELPQPAANEGPESLSREEILDAVREGMIASQEPSDLSRALTGGSSFSRDDIIDAVRDGYVHAMRNNKELETEVLERLEEVIEGMRQEFRLVSEEAKQNLAAGGRDTEQLLDALKDGLQDLKEDLQQQVKPAEQPAVNHDEVILAIRDSHDRLKSIVERAGDRPVDMTGTDEILDALREGIASLRVDIDNLKDSHEGVKEDITKSVTTATHDKGAVIIADGLQRGDIQNLEVMIAQLRIKVEAMDANTQSRTPPAPTATPAPAAGPSLKRDDLIAVEGMVHSLQSGIDELIVLGKDRSDMQFTREDLDAIENLLSNTKAKIDALDVPNLELLASKDDVEVLASALKSIRESVLGFVASSESAMLRKADVEEITDLLKDLKSGVRDVEDKVVENAAAAKREDFEAIETLITNMKAKIDDFSSLKPDTLPTKEDIEGLADFMKELKSRTEEFSEASSKVFEDQSNALGERVEAVGLMIAEIKDEISAKLESHSKGVKDFATIFESASGNIADNFKETLSTVDKGFRATQDSLDRTKDAQDERAIEILEKMEIFATLIDELRSSAKDKDAAVSDTKEVADELKILVEALGITFSNTSEKNSSESKAVFDKLESGHNEARDEHVKTRQEVQRSLTAVEAFRTELGEHNPKVLNGIKDLRTLITQQFELAQSQANQKAREQQPVQTVVVPPMIQDVPHSKFDDSEIQVKLDRILSHTTVSEKAVSENAAPQAELLEEVNKHVKAMAPKTDLLEEVNNNVKALAPQTDLLEEVNKQIQAMSAELTEFMATQATLLSQTHDDKEKLAEEAGRALDQRVTQKQIVEADVVRLSEDRDTLKEEIAALRAERDQLASEKLKLTGEVASFETAIKLRREELHMVEARAEGLERRILEGVIDHSRALLISRPGKANPNNMSLKRVSSTTSNSTVTSLPQSSIGMALKKRAIPRASVPNFGSGERRIHSLNQITSNVPTGAQAFGLPSSTLGTHSTAKTLGGLKRSQSVKTGSGAGAGAVYNRKASLTSVTDKENSTEDIAEQEEDEQDSHTDSESVIVTNESERPRGSSRPSFILNNAETLIGVEEEEEDEGVHHDGRPSTLELVLHSDGERLFNKDSDSVDGLDDGRSVDMPSTIDVELN